MARIISTQSVLGGKPRIAGTRISVDLVSSYLSHGYGVKEIKRDYPHLTYEQIDSALKYLERRASEESRKLEPTSS